MTNYMQRTMVASKVCVPSTAGVELRFGSKNNDFIIHGIDVCVMTAGAQANSAIKLQTSDGATDLAAITIGTADAGTMYEAKLTDANQQRTANTSVRLLSVTNDASLVYYVRVFGTVPIY